MHRRHAVCFSLAVLAAFATTANAGERIPVKGAYAAINKGQMVEVGPNHVMIAAYAEGLGYIIEGAGAATPMQHAAGPCAGSIEIRNGSAKGSGYCVRKTPQGAKWIVTWSVDPDLSKGLRGTFDIQGVEGASLGWKGGGTWGPTVDTTPTSYINPFSGYLEKP
jgi:hypothetical protein